MGGVFLSADKVVREELDWGVLGWLCRPSETGMKDLVVIEVTFAPGGSHAFHRHPSQEELIYCLEGELEQWLGQEKQILRAGDSVIIPPGTVHATFSTSGGERALAVLGPARNDDNGYEVEEMADQPPWQGLR